jgi:pimeloyl-ACP methyl ester carboxylesterase
VKTMTHEVRAANGELILVEDFGGPTGKPVLVHAGGPGSRRLFRPDAQYAAREYGLRLLSYDRPGYWGRPRKQGRVIADAAEDVQRIAAALGIERLGMWGFSGGGAYALACAVPLPELVAGVAVFAGFAPYGSPPMFPASRRTSSRTRTTRTSNTTTARPPAHGSAS